VHAPVARGAAEPLRDVDRVVEIDEPRELVDPVPGDGRAREVAAPDHLEHGALTPDLVMTTHALLGGGDTRRGRPIHAIVALPAADAVVARVVAVIELDRLVGDLVLRASPGGARPDHRPGEGAEAAERRRGDGEPERGVAPRRKNGGHSPQSVALRPREER